MAVTKRIAVGSDHAGFRLKKELEKQLAEWGYEIEDFGSVSEESVDYPDFAHALARSIQEKRHTIGLLVCGTGIGMSIAANRHPGVRAAACSDTFSARMARAHNDANVLCVGARVLGVGLATDVLKSFLDSAFEGGRHARRVEKMELSS